MITSKGINDQWVCNTMLSCNFAKIENVIVKCFEISILNFPCTQIN